MKDLRYKSTIYNLVITAMFVTMATIVHVIEGMLPPLPIPGAKLGLANVITLTVLMLMGPKRAFAVAATRTVLGSLFTFGIISPGFALSFSGAMLSWAVMALLHRWVGSVGFIGLSLAGAIFHNLAQLTVASLYLSQYIYSLFPILMFFALPTGIMVGLTARLLTRALGKVTRQRR